MKGIGLLVHFLILLAVSPLYAQELPAFPGAQGFGSTASGGRGGEVIYVTNLNDAGPGSLREALSTEGPRTVVFGVSGYIELERIIDDIKPDLTIAGQTAPEDGITLKNYGLYLKNTQNIIIRHLKIRPGDDVKEFELEKQAPGLTQYAITISDSNTTEVIIDHVSMSWSVNKLMVLWDSAHHVTVQNCLISEALSNSYYYQDRPNPGDKHEHSKAFLIGDSCQNISVHHNVFAHHNDRSPVQVKGGAKADIVNNITYNWGEYAFSLAFDYIKTPNEVNFMNNYFKRGNNSLHSGFFNGADSVVPGSKLYLDGNKGDDPLLIDFNENPQTYYDAYDFLVQDPINWEGNIDYDDIELIYNDLLRTAGARWSNRDAIDERIISDIINTTGFIIDSTEQVGGFPTIEPFILGEEGLDSIDTDRDGMPDKWEIARNLNPNDYSDAQGTTLSTAGYTNIEVYINGLYQDLITSNTAVTKMEPFIFKVVPSDFNSTFDISFETPIQQHVLLDIYDTNGQFVENLINHDLGKGSYTVHWSGVKKYDNSAKLYLIRLQTDHTVQTLKVFIE